MTEILLTIIILALLILSYLERKDLQNRLMSKDLRDFKDNTQKDEPNHLEEKEENLFLDLEDSRELIEKDLNA